MATHPSPLHPLFVLGPPTWIVVLAVILLALTVLLLV